jgi:hypothetical protein
MRPEGSQPRESTNAGAVPTVVAECPTIEAVPRDGFEVWE